MSQERRIWIAVVVILILIIVFQYWQTRPIYEKVETLEGDIEALEAEIETLEEDFPHKITEINGPLGERLIGEKVTVEGYLVFIGEREPILVQNLDLLFINMPIPVDRFIPIVGFDPKDIIDLNGGLVRMKARLIEHEERLALDLDIVDWEVDLLDILEIAKYLMFPYRIEISPGQFLIHRNFAVLISGGGNAAYYRYWNDLKWMYSILVNDYGYLPSQIIVIYKDGVGEDTAMPVNYATLTNVTTSFSIIADELGSNDDLFIFTTNHGSGFHPTDPYGQYLYGDIDTDGDETETGYSEFQYDIDFNLDGDKNDIIQVDEVLNLYQNERLVDDDLADMLNNITCRQMIIVMEQCFSGGFIHDLSANNRVVMTACLEEEFSYACDSFAEGNYDEFVYHFMSGIEKPDLDGDDDGDGKVSMSEAFNFAAQSDSTSETPIYDDNGDNTGHPEPLPNSGDGPAGDSTYI